MRRSLLSALAIAAALASRAPASHAQGTTTPASAPASAPMPRPVNDSLFRYARRLVLDGNGPAGRALVDSLLNAAAPGSAAYGDALYWHGALAPTLAEAERDYRRVIVEYPLAFYADDALLAIAELEQGRGDRPAALAHLMRFVKEHPASPARGIAALAAARLAFEQRDTKVGCAMIAEARASVGKGDVELTNQIAYYSARCPATATPVVAKMGSVPVKPSVAADTSSATKGNVPRVAPDSLPTPGAAHPPVPEPRVAAAPKTVATTAPIATKPATTPPSVTPKPVTTPAPVAEKPVSHAPVTPAPRPVASAPASAPHAAARHGRYTIQLAAYNTRPEAERFAEGLVKRGLPARVSGEVKPFRVRLGYYPTRGAAAAEVAALKARGIVSFVAEEP